MRNPRFPKKIIQILYLLSQLNKENKTMKVEVCLFPAHFL